MRTRIVATAAFLFTIAAARANGQDLKSVTSAAPEYARYPTPAACVAAVERVDGAATWGENSDSFPYHPDRPLPAVAVAAARRCIERFLPAGGVATLADKDVDAMFLLGLTAGNDSVASAALRRTVTAQRSRRDTLDVLVGALDMYLGGRPRRLGLARAVVRRLDSLNYHPDLPPGQWSTPHSRVLDLARFTLDSAVMAEQSKAVLAAVRALPERERGGQWVLGAVMSALSGDLLWTLRAQGPDSALAQLKSQVTALLGPDVFGTSQPGFSLLLLGKPAPPLEPNFWFGRDLGDSVLPRGGRITLIRAACRFCDNAVLRRLKARFGESLELILLARTMGRRGPYIPLAPAQEAELMRDSYLDTQRLSAKLGVWITQYTSRPDPDRRRVEQDPAPDLGRYQGGGGWLVDRRGIVLPTVVGGYRSEDEAFLTAMLDALVRRTWEHSSP